MNRRIAASVALLALLAAGAWLCVERPARADTPRIGAPGGPQRVVHDAARPEAVIDPAARALARAVAAAGRAEDGEAEAERALDGSARAALPEAKRLLATAKRRSPGTGDPASAMIAGGPDDRGSASPASTGSAPGGVLDAGRAPDPRAALRETPDGPVLRRAGLWAKSDFRPSASRSSWTIRNESGSAYAISVDAADFSAIRLDGGLIVPGRFYAVGAATTLASDVPCTNVIRPVDAIAVMYDSPLFPIVGNG
jgi:hypothetical protein